MALDLSDEVNAIVMKASRASLREPRIRTILRRRFAAWKVRCPTRELRGADPGVSAKFSREQARLNQKLLTAMTRRSARFDKL
jgi:hypothetical protein